MACKKILHDVLYITVYAPGASSIPESWLKKLKAICPIHDNTGIRTHLYQWVNQSCHTNFKVTVIEDYTAVPDVSQQAFKCSTEPEPTGLLLLSLVPEPWLLESWGKKKKDTNCIPRDSSETRTHAISSILGGARQD